MSFASEEFNTAFDKWQEWDLILVWEVNKWIRKR